MRKIDSYQLQTEDWQQWIDDCEQETKDNIEAFKQGEEIKFKSKLYRPKKLKDIYFFGKGKPFYGKCAYCEFPISDFQPGDIEHFRPKAGVTDENDNKITFKDPQGNPILEQGEPKLHSGYYWLAYDLNNLLPSCAACNRPRANKLGKRSRFPVMGNHAQAPGEEIDEKPLWINPASSIEADDPEKHFTFDLDTGLIIGLSDRGKMCIKIFGLNERDQLITTRKHIRNHVEFLIVQMEKSLSRLADPQKSRQEALAEIISFCDKLVNIWEGKEACTTTALKTLKEKGFSLEWLKENKKLFEELLATIS